MQDVDKEAKPHLGEALSLLSSWNLQNLCTKFKEQEVCTVAFQYLTDEDICELIPKIGPRAIFRSHLLAWRQQKEIKKDDHVILLNSDQVDTTVAIKDELPEITLEDEHASNLYDDPTKESEVYEDSDSKTASMMSDAKYDDSPIEKASTSKRHLDVKSVLKSCYEGMNAIEYYEENKCLDMHHRKKVVKIIISAALDKRMDMSVHDFHGMNKQLLQLFPNESDVSTSDTFYMPRLGHIRARGMLYNKYVNLARTLRKDGLLEYRRHWTNKRR
ncbi:uncharacterized protein LOC118735864 isoform X2 [Rhagoletis pomonella]|uniref:uncharacterized protein LOC118735864 isoform X2 n=1 Tax=Rhagoletis pomonella TaxID=28610 RepID=UPI00177F2203|nr:uncharacterized protein LOC118735864 isoform X2 [Rhagoletis pomonella]